MNKNKQTNNQNLSNKYNKEYLQNLRVSLKKSINKKYLVFNGGGIKGICFLGVLQYLIDTDNIKDFNVFVGTSVSSMILFLYLIGYIPQDLLYFVLNYNFNEFQQLEIDNLFINYGLNNGEVIKKILTTFIKSKNLSIDITFKELYDLTHKLLIITGTNITKKQGEYFSFLTTPDMKLIDAIRISTSIPFYFTPYKYNNNYYIDGSCTNDLAVNSLYTQPFLNFILKNDTFDNIKNNIFSVYLDDINNGFSNLLEYSFNVLNVLEQNNIDFNNITLIIDTKNIKAFNFSLDNKIKNKLYNIGYDSIYNKYKN